MTDGPIDRSAPAEGPAAGSERSRRKESRESLLALVETGLVGIVLVLVLLAALQLYVAVQETIRYWVADQYVPLVNAVFFIAIIAGGIFVLLHRLFRKGS
jgi:sterol desaturase/sphingolipid hydroxylase (fatty acid hydroxylase superfamily)